ncbi:hypothetical protein SYNTR_1335 [Candidatus Syntrophocurvum alkaliphilum]|uniref:Uncharacterized protein n=1 Tax=Candidatus Syntrophocurvum alkaliphilum TaxID=2293317 RepID=A0A6I6DAY4_9FIRM|nr:hypothetical protein SYNTR_1335 [Candidatus Syntrophocurvum alkaliphilum]
MLTCPFITKEKKSQRGRVGVTPHDGVWRGEFLYSTLLL